MTADLILYTQTDCAESARARTWLAHRDAAFQERNVSRDQEAAQALVATGVFATPLLTCGEDRVLGFRPDALERILLSCATPNSASHE
ncbi:MAG: glutaredoxin family protein [Chloroflexi bacterium]|nr:glutaredoxin family protein [Chloroflexota bacterium]